MARRDGILSHRSTRPIVFRNHAVLPAEWVRHNRWAITSFPWPRPGPSSNQSRRERRSGDEAKRRHHSAIRGSHDGHAIFSPRSCPAKVCEPFSLCPERQRPRHAPGQVEPSPCRTHRPCTAHTIVTSSRYTATALPRSARVKSCAKGGDTGTERGFLAPRPRCYILRRMPDLRQKGHGPRTSSPTPLSRTPAQKGKAFCSPFGDDRDRNGARLGSDAARPACPWTAGRRIISHVGRRRGFLVSLCPFLFSLFPLQR